MSNILDSGQVLVERYEVKKYLAAGGMQEVYSGWDKILERQVVVKTPKRGTKDRRFKRGAEMSARVNHPNIAATFDYCDENGLTFLVEELIEGTDLGQRLIRDFIFMDPALTAHVVHHIARALYEAHRAGICHRDLKPSNIVVSNDYGLEVIKLTDFGIAKLAESTIAQEMDQFDKDESSLTSSNTLLGAVPYMAPECWRNWQDAGQPIDIWALGCLAYQLLAGAPPFGTGRQAIANVVRAEQQGQVQLAKPAWFGKHPSTATLEQALWNIISACLAIDAAARPAAKDILTQCGSLCYAAAKRSSGVITTYPIQYANGRKGKCGFITDEQGANQFFHESEFFGMSKPAALQRVCFSAFKGDPKPRLSPVLLLRAQESF